MSNSDRFMYRDDTVKPSVYHIHGKTFHVKDEIKALGGQWNPTNKSWTVPNTLENLEALRLLHISLRVKVKREAFCHEDEGVVYVDSADADNGFVHDNFCGNCDSSYRRPVRVERID